MKNITLNNRLIHAYNFRHPGATLDFELKPLSACLIDGLVVLDANVLLLPLMTGALTLTAIEQVFTKLIGENRLHIPTHALREYLANRPTKIKELIDQLMKKKEKEYVSSSSPLLQKARIFDELTAAEKALKEESRKVSKVIESAIVEIKKWETNDPVSAMYRGIRLSERLLPDPIDLDSKQEVDAFFEENDERVANKIPPGFKDGKKDENDIGDFLIWKTILKLGEINVGKDLTFVSGEIKTDWIYRSAGQALHVREELIEEYREASCGGSFHLIDFATLLKEFKASSDVVDEVRSSEVITSLSISQKDEDVDSNSNLANLKWEDFAKYSLSLVGAWLRDTGISNLSRCENRFAHYTGEYETSKMLFHIRPLRHVEHVAKRIKEIGNQLLSEVATYKEIDPERNFRSAIIFVCENSNDSNFVARYLESATQIDSLIVRVGHLLDNKFVQV